MSIMATGVSINTSQRMVLYRGFKIEEAYDPKTGADAWEWTHENYGHAGEPHSDVTGDCQTLFECIDAVEAWHEAQPAA